MPLQIRRGTEAERLAMTEPLQEGEPLFITDDNVLYIGRRNQDGTLSLPRDLTSTDSYSDTQARSTIIDMLTNAYHPDIRYYYDPNTRGLNITLNLDELEQNIIPNVGATYDLGSADKPFKDLYLSGNSLWLGDAKITANNSVIDLPAGSTLNGELLTGGQGTSGTFTGELIGNVLSDTNEIILNSFTHTMTGDVIGDVTGDVTGDIYGTVFGDVFAQEIHCDTINTSNDAAILTSPNVGDLKFTFVGNTGRSIIQLINEDTSVEFPPTAELGSVFIGRKDSTGKVISSAITSFSDKLTITQADINGEYSDNNIITFDSIGNCVIGGTIPEAKLDVRGDIKLTGAIFGPSSTNTVTIANNLEVSGTLYANGTFNDTPPASSIGAPGDTEGMMAANNTHIYRCIADYDGTSNIWVRIQWTIETW